MNNAIFSEKDNLGSLKKSEALGANFEDKLHQQEAWKEAINKTNLDIATPTANATKELKWSLPADLRGNLLQSMQLQIQVGPATVVLAKDVADIRPGQVDGTFVLDFGAMRTVAGVAVIGIVEKVEPGEKDEVFNHYLEYARIWKGTAFSTTSIATANLGDKKRAFEFGEQFTEKLLVSLFSPADLKIEDVKKRLVLYTPAPPAGLELRFEDRLIYTHIDAVALQDGKFKHELDVTSAVAQALLRGTWPLAFELRTPMPCQLQLSAQMEFLRRYVVPIDSDLHHFEVEQPGALSLRLPIAAETQAQVVHRVDLQFVGEMSTERILPSGALPISADAHLQLDSDHPLALRVPTVCRTRLSEISSLWLPLLLLEDELEISVALVVGKDGVAPTTKDIIAQSEVIRLENQTPAAIDQDPRSALLLAGPPQWQVVQLAKPIAFPRGNSPCWILLNASRGKALLGAHGQPTAVEPDDRSEFLRGRSSGAFLGFQVQQAGASGAVDAMALLAAMRISGKPTTPNEPLALEVIAGSQLIGLTPQAKAQDIELDLGTVAVGAAQEVQLQLQLCALGTFEVQSATVYYRKAGDDAAV